MSTDTIILKFSILFIILYSILTGIFISNNLQVRVIVSILLIKNGLKNLQNYWLSTLQQNL